VSERHLQIASNMLHAGTCAADIMLSTAQALKEWDSVLKLLAKIKADAAAHPNQHSLPNNLRRQLDEASNALAMRLASPNVTWKQLLKKKVRQCMD
jgi:hypothetical protein